MQSLTQLNPLIVLLTFLTNPQSVPGVPTKSLMLFLTKEEITLLRSSTSELGTTDKGCVSLQLKIVNAILDAGV